MGVGSKIRGVTGMTLMKGAATTMRRQDYDRTKRLVEVTILQVMRRGETANKECSAEVADRNDDDDQRESLMQHIHGAVSTWDSTDTSVHRHALMPLLSVLAAGHNLTLIFGVLKAIRECSRPMRCGAYKRSAEKPPPSRH